MALFNLSSIVSDVTNIKTKTDLLVENGGNLETTTNLKVIGTLQSTQAITSGDDITAFGTVS